MRGRIKMEKHELPERKVIRLKNYDYSKSGYYFVTICSYQRKNLLSEIEMDKVFPTDIGKVIESSFNNIPKIFIGVCIDQYIIMPNHIHAIWVIDNSTGSNPVAEDKKPTLQNIISRFKSYTTHMYNEINNTKGLQLWQIDFYEHVIRDDQELRDTREYMQNNPIKWTEDKYYTS